MNMNITKWIQNKLKSFGYNRGAADGIFGQNTKNAVIAFQRAKGLIADGIVGPKTWSKLLGLSQSEKAVVCQYVGHSDR